MPAVSLGTLIVALFLQETAGLSATEAGLATLPLPVLSFFLARRFGTLAGVHGPRLFMAVGPLIAAAGFVWMMMAREPFNFWTQMLPGLVVFGLGLSITVSPLTAAILAAVDPAQSGIGSAINNAVSRISGLIAIALTGVIIWRRQWSCFAGFRQGALVTAGLFAVAGLISAIGIRNAQCDFDRVSPENAACCHDRTPPPPAYARALTLSATAHAVAAPAARPRPPWWPRTTARRRPRAARRPPARSPWARAESSPARRRAAGPAA